MHAGNTALRMSFSEIRACSPHFSTHIHIVPKSMSAVGLALGQNLPFPKHVAFPKIVHSFELPGAQRWSGGQKIAYLLTSSTHLGKIGFLRKSRKHLLPPNRAG